MTLRLFAALALALPMLGCMPHGNLGFGSENMMFMHDHGMHWPTVRIDGLDGARVTMKRGVFGDGLDVRAPFQGEFQPTGDHPTAGYPLEIDLDQDIARRYGAQDAVRLRAALMVPEHMRRHGILRIDITDCEIRALLAGDLDVLKLHSDELPTPERACRPDKREREEHGASCSCGHKHAMGHGEGMHGWHERMGWGMPDQGKAVLLLAVEKPGEHAF